MVIRKRRDIVGYSMLRRCESKCGWSVVMRIGFCGVLKASFWRVWDGFGHWVTWHLSDQMRASDCPMPVGYHLTLMPHMRMPMKIKGRTFTGKE